MRPAPAVNAGSGVCAPAGPGSTAPAHTAALAASHAERFIGSSMVFHAAPAGMTPGAPEAAMMNMKEFERWEGRYAPESYLFGTAPNAFLARQKARLPKSGRALSIA